MNTPLLSIRLLPLLWVGLFSAMALPGFSQSQVTLTVGTEARQEMRGIGFSIHRAKPSFLPADPATFQQLYTETFGSFNSMVFWSYIENPTERDQLISSAMQYGLRDVIVNTTGEPQTPAEHAQNLLLEIDEYKQAGYPVYGTTIMNKPNTDESGALRQAPTFLTEAAKLLRAKLDSAGYQDIKIGGPSTIEWSPYMDPTAGGAAHGYSFQPGDNLMYLQAFLDDPAALAVLDAFDFQSYGWSIDTVVQALAEQHGKALWVTLAATDGFQNNNGARFLAPVVAANCLANLNHGVASWNHWVWDQLINFNTGQPNRRMRYLQQIGQHFRAGAKMRQVRADAGQVSPTMAWRYHDFQAPASSLQPEIVAAAGFNADSTFSLAVINLAGIHAQHFFSEEVPAEAQTYQVSLEVPELTGLGEVAATVTYCDMEQGTVTTEPALTLVNGQATFNLPYGDMLLLQTEPLDLSTSREAVRAVAAFSLWPNPTRGPVQLRYELEAPATVEVSLLDGLGRQLWQQALGPQAAGSHQAGLSLPAGLAEGLYLLRLHTRDGQGRAQVSQQRLLLRGDD